MTQVNLLALQRQADIRNSEMLLEHALPLIIKEAGAVTAVEVFRLTRGGMVVWHVENSTGEAGTFIPLESNAVQQKAIEEQVPLTDAEAQVVFAPLIYGNECSGLLALHYEQTLDENFVRDLADDLSLMLYSRQMNSLLQQQIGITGKLSIASSLEEITTIIAGSIAEAQQFVSMNVFDYDNQGKVSGGRVIATANRTTGFNQELNLEINLSALQELHRLLLADGDVIVSDIDTEDRFTEEAKVWLREQKINSMVIVPLWISADLHAFICLADTGRSLALSELEKALFHNIAHQASIGIEKTTTARTNKTQCCAFR